METFEFSTDKNPQKFSWAKDLGTFIGEASSLGTYLPRQFKLKSPTGKVKLFRFSHYDTCDGGEDIAGANYVNAETGLRALIIND